MAEGPLPAGGEVGFVVRDGGRWLVAPVPGSTSTPVALADVLRLLPAPTAPAAAPAVPLGVGEVVAPVWAWVGRVLPDGVVVEGNDGERLVLGERDLRLLDGLVAPVTVGELAEATGVVDAAERLAWLVAAGRVKVLGEAGPGVVSEVATVAEAEPEVVGEVVSSGVVSSAPVVVEPVRAVRRRVGGGGRVGVHAVWQEQVGPALSLGMLTACARGWEGGVLNEWFDIGVPSTAEEVLGDLAALRDEALRGGEGASGGGAVLLLSNYVWSVEFNVEVARRAKALCPGLVVVHGGPSTPKYPGDAERFLVEFGDVADVSVRGEGEVTLCRVLQALGPGLDVGRLGSVAGLTFRDPVSGEVVRTADPERVADLDSLPSPYLSGEFDHIDPAAWVFAVSVETNRGCPYGCTFCDWGSAILSRIRKFDVDRVLAEFRWAAERGIAALQLCDANFGIMSRDVVIAEGLAEIARHHHAPRFLSFTPAKNTTKHVTKVLDAAIDAGLLVSTAISLQTTDEATLAAVDRSNISTDGYLALAADLRRRGLPLTGDVLIGLPGQTYEAFRADLQFFLDHQISPRCWSLRALPNAPMNAPDYRARYAIRTGDDQIVLATSTMSEQDRARMLGLRKVQVVADQYGVLGHVLRFLQWDHGIAMAHLLDHLLSVTTETPDRFPLLAWLFENFDLHATAPVGWRALYAQLGELLAQDFGLDPQASDLQTVLRLQVALMPAPERTFPAMIELAHDGAAYFSDATAALYTTGRATAPPQPLAAYPPASFTVDADPLRLCANGLRFGGDSRDESMLGQFWIGVGSSHELLSPLTRVSPAFRHLELAAAGARPETMVSLR